MVHLCIYIYILVLTPSNFWMGFCWSSCLLDLVSMLRSHFFRFVSRCRFKFIQVRAWPGSVSEERGGFGRSVWLLRRLWTLLGSLFSLLGHPWEVFGSHGRPIEALRRSLGVPGNPWRGSSWSLGGPEGSLGGPETSMGGHWDPRGSPGVPPGSLGILFWRRWRVPGESLRCLRGC